MERYRNFNCNELREIHVGLYVYLAGWVHSLRDHGGVCFIDLRDHYGITQVVVNPDCPFFQETRRLHPEYVIRVGGMVAKRDEETVNPKIPTGTVELHVREFEILSSSKPLPFSVFPETPVPERLRLRYRFLDLRRKTVHDRIMLRSEVIRFLREKMWSLGFPEFQTPILTASSPEGARDFLVPSRLHPGCFYALPQAPQIFKQLLMTSGFDRYFQIAPCFRDEDARADRSPGEFYQLDIEMAFVTQDEVFAVVEEVISETFNRFSGQDKRVDQPPFVRIPYREAILRFGSDKPDLRNPLEMKDVTEIFKDTEFKAFTSVVQQGGVVRAIPVKKIVDLPRKFFDDMITFAQSVGSKGLGYIGWQDGSVRSPIAKFLSDHQLDQLRQLCGIENGDVVFFIADTKDKASKIGSEVIRELGHRLNLIDTNRYAFCWITDFPMYELNPITGSIQFSHNPFSMPQGGLEALNTKDPLEILAWQYDLVCNGVELSSGALRNYHPDIMIRAFEIGGYTREELETNFRALFDAFHYGAPPHGGIAPGIDRIVMLLTGVDNIREVIAFPMTQQAQDLLLGAPAPVKEEQLRELHIRLRLPPKS